MAFLIFLLILAAVALYVMKPEERAPVVRAGREALARARAEAARRWEARGKPREDAGPREPLPILTLLILTINVLVFLRMFLTVTLADADTLVGWGANFAPRTTNGEWWRLLTSMFVHGSLLHAAATVVGLFHVSVITERLAGRVSFALVYVAAGVFGGLVSLAQAPVAANIGASSAVYGVYGLFAAAAAWTFIHRSPIKVPRQVLKTMLVAIGAFVLYNALTDWLVTGAERTGLAVGFFSGLVLASGAAAERPTIRRLAGVGAATLVMTIALAVPLRGVADVRPDIARVIAMDQRATEIYEARVSKFTAGYVQAKALTDIIDRTILPELQATWGRLRAIQGVPKEHQAIVAAADQFLQLREKSWRLRSEALRKGNMRTLQQADKIEWDAKAALAHLKEIVPE